MSLQSPKLKTEKEKRTRRILHCIIIKRAYIDDIKAATAKAREYAGDDEFIYTEQKPTSYRFYVTPAYFKDYSTRKQNETVTLLYGKIVDSTD